MSITTIEERQLREMRLANAQLDPGYFLLSKLFWPAAVLLALFVLCAVPMIIQSKPQSKPQPSQAGLHRPASPSHISKSKESQ